MRNRLFAYSLLSFLLILITSCKEGVEPSDDELEESFVPPVLEVVLSIGEEMGDSCYVFGDITDACITAEGNIWVLDGVTNKITAYDFSGNFLYRAGGSGEGPGEFQHPFCLTSLSDERVLVSDPALNRATFFNTDLIVDTTISGFIPWSPDRTAPGADGSYTGGLRTFDRENSMYGHLLALWDDSPQVEREYYRRECPFNRERLRESTEESQIVFTSDFQGRVYVAEYSYSNFSVVIFDPTGNLLYSIEEEREPALKPLEEIENERAAMHRQLQSEDAPPDLQWNPSEFRCMIPLRGLGVDARERLWVRDGRESLPVFDVYAEGEHLFRTSLDESVEDIENLRVKITQRGILAWPTDPECYPQLHILTVVE